MPDVRTEVLVRFVGTTADRVVTIPNRERRFPEGKPRRAGAGDRTRTGTVSLPVDFESTTSTNSITPACGATGQIRTGDLLITNQLRYLLRYNSMWWACRDSNPGLSGYEPEALTN